MARGYAIVVLLVGAGACRSDVEQAGAVFEAAEQLGTPGSLPEPAPVPTSTGGDPCAASPGALVAVTRDAPSALRVHDGTVYWATPGLHAARPGETARELRAPDPAWDITGLDVSQAGAFMIVQSARGPARTHLEWRAPDGTVTRAMDADDVLLNDVVATPAGAYLLSGRVLDSAGPASQLLYFSVADRSSHVRFARDRGALYLVADEARLYWIEYPHTGRGQSGSSAIVTARMTGGDVTTLREGAAVLSALAVDGEHLYWVERGDLLESAGRLMRMPKGGGAPAVVRAAVRSAHVLVEPGIVIAQADDESVLVRIDPRSGDAAPIVDEPAYVARPVLDRGVLYWATAPRRYATLGCIRTLRLP